MKDNLYAIYTYEFIEKKDEGDLWEGQVIVPDKLEAQNTLYGLFGVKNTDFYVQEEISDGTKKYICKVYGNDHRIVALRLQNEKEEWYWEDEYDPDDPMGKVVKKPVKSRPATFVVIDCRPGYNIIAVKVEKDAWSNTDTVRDLMKDSINRYLESDSKGYRVQLITKMYERHFFNYSKYRIKEEGRTLKSMTITFKTGKLNPKIEAIVKGSQFLKQLFQVIDKYSISGEMKLNEPIGEKLIDRRRHDIENLIALVLCDPKGYGLDMIFDDDMTLHCGKDARAEIPMDPKGALELFHTGEFASRKKEQLQLFEEEPNMIADKYLIESWLDEVAEETKKMKDAETVRRKRSRKNRRSA